MWKSLGISGFMVLLTDGLMSTCPTYCLAYLLSSTVKRAQHALLFCLYHSFICIHATKLHEKFMQYVAILQFCFMLHYKTSSSGILP